MVAAVSIQLDLEAPGGVPIRLGDSILKPDGARRYISLCYNHKPQLRPDSKGTVLREQTGSLLSIDEGGTSNVWRWTGEEVGGDEGGYVLTFQGEGKTRTAVLEKLDGRFVWNLQSTPQAGPDETQKQHAHITAADMRGASGPDADNPYDYRHYLQEEAAPAVKTQASPAIGALKPDSKPVEAPSRPAAAKTLPLDRKRKAPVSADESVKKKPKTTVTEKKTTEAKGAAKARPANGTRKAPSGGKPKSAEPRPTASGSAKATVEKKEFSAKEPTPQPKSRADTPTSVDAAGSDFGELILDNPTPEEERRPPLLNKSDGAANPAPLVLPKREEEVIDVDEEPADDDDGDVEELPAAAIAEPDSDGDDLGAQLAAALEEAQRAEEEEEISEEE
ncbi:hypothetical protein K470DRAFT_267652 [Piedraia hortae CBS 480.64]|uniref:Transcription elongation factor Eaf N-terminal domain-containing protein n=1 Tax=Piedraia hortae CBS 480.64 TaxID=1314780 RepID=A0A6A7C9E3_9PEZI|nr:hypothetical protein K470DRAFT_267652 [Piedraia hortae CBS 480.64]